MWSRYSPALNCDAALRTVCESTCDAALKSKTLPRLSTTANPRLGAAWRCYALEALTPDTLAYSPSSGSSSYCTRHAALLSALNQCRQEITSKIATNKEGASSCDAQEADENRLLDPPHLLAPSHPWVAELGHSVSRVWSTQPLVLTVDGFLDAQECELLINATDTQKAEPNPPRGCEECGCWCAILHSRTNSGTALISFGLFFRSSFKQPLL